MFLQLGKLTLTGAFKGPRTFREVPRETVHIVILRHVIINLVESWFNRRWSIILGRCELDTFS